MWAWHSPQGAAVACFRRPFATRRVQPLRPVPSDIDIVNAVEPLPIGDIADDAGVLPEELELHGDKKETKNFSMPMSAPNPAWVSDEELAQTQLAGEAAKQLSGLEVVRARGGRSVAIGVAINLGDVIARVLRRVPGHRVGIQCYHHLGLVGSRCVQRTGRGPCSTAGHVVHRRREHGNREA